MKFYMVTNTFIFPHYTVSFTVAFVVFRLMLISIFVRRH